MQPTTYLYITLASALVTALVIYRANRWAPTQTPTPPPPTTHLATIHAIPHDKVREVIQRGKEVSDAPTVAATHLAKWDLRLLLEQAVPAAFITPGSWQLVFSGGRPYVVTTELLSPDAQEPALAEVYVAGHWCRVHQPESVLLLTEKFRSRPVTQS